MTSEKGHGLKSSEGNIKKVDVKWFQINNETASYHISVFVKEAMSVFFYNYLEMVMA